VIAPEDLDVIARSPWLVLVDNTLDIVQTSALVALTLGFIYVIIRLERTLGVAAGSLTDVLGGIARNAKRLDEIEVQLDGVERQVQGTAQGDGSQGGGAIDSGNRKKPPAGF
jgi:hypothetical protein